MKKFSGVLLFALVLSAILLFCSCGAEDEGIKLIDIGLTEEEYAFVIKKGNFNLTSDFNSYVYGLDIEIIAGYAESRGLELVIKTTLEFDDIFPQIEAGYADIGMAGITVTEDRAELYDFTNTYYNASQKIIVSAGNTAFDNCKTAADVEALFASLKGEKIGYQTGTTGSLYINGDEDWAFSGFSNIEGKNYSTALGAVDKSV